MESIVEPGQQPFETLDVSETTCIDYVNHRGQRSVRRIIPQRLFFGEVDWHPGPQWILEAWDVDKAAVRSFAMNDICRWGV